ncbi:hypothetical protein ABPG72_017703, partial [Tetrahymena utriculariae]
MSYYQSFLGQQEQLQLNNCGISNIDSLIQQSDNYSTESYSIEIKEQKSYEIKQLQIATNNEELKNYIQQSHLYRQFQEDQQFILEGLENLGYKLHFIIGGHNSILISGLHQQNKKQIVIKIVNNENNQDEIINNQNQIHDLLNKTKEGKYFIECIEHIRIMNWNCFVFKRYSSSLKQECENKQKLKNFNEQNFLNNVFDLIHGLIDLRRLGIIHLDIKPDNILVDEDENLIYCDFGISQIKKQGQEIEVRGYTEFFAPKEQKIKELNNQLDFETDVYSLGKTLNYLINHFRELNPQNRITSFVNNLETIIKSQMIQEDVKQRKNCYEIYSQLHDLFIQIPKDFISEKLTKDVEQYLKYHVDYYFEDIDQALVQAKDQIKKLFIPKDYQNSLNNKNKQYIKRLIQEFQDQKRFQKDQSKESIDKQVQEELQFLQERFQNLVFNSKQNNYFDMKSLKNFDETLNQMNQCFQQDLKENSIKKELQYQDLDSQIFKQLNSLQVEQILKSYDDMKQRLLKLIKIELSQFQEFQKQDLIDKFNSTLELKIQKNKQNKDQISLKDVVNKLFEYVSSQKIDTIFEICGNFKQVFIQSVYQNLKQRNQIEIEILLSNTREYEKINLEWNKIQFSCEKFEKILYPYQEEFEKIESSTSFKYINLLINKLIEQEALIYELNNSFIEYLLKYFDAHQNRYLEQKMHICNLNQVLLEQDYIQGIKSFLDELKRCKTAEILCLLKQISIKDLKQLQNDLNNLQNSYKNKLDGLSVQNLAESSLFIMEFYNQIKQTILQQRLKQFTFTGFRELLQTTQPNDIYIKDNEKLDLDFIIICVEVQLKKLTQQEQINLFKDVNSKDKSQIINELNDHQINELSQQISICFLCTQNIQQLTQTKEDKFSIQATQQMFNKII